MRDHTKACLMGFDLPLDRCPSDQDSRVAFTLGVWAREFGHPRPVGLQADTHPLLGDFWWLHLGRPVGSMFLQCWPHPQNPQQVLVIEVRRRPVRRIDVGTMLSGFGELG